MKQAFAYLESDTRNPFVIYGSSGCGKTSIMAKVVERLCTVDKLFDKEPICIARFLGTSPLTSNLHQVLVSICQQLMKLQGKTWEEPEKLSDLIKCFHECLTEGIEEKTMVFTLYSLGRSTPAVWNSC